MSPRLILCYCDLPFNHGRPVLACCERCEAKELRTILEQSDVPDPDHPSVAAWQALLASYQADAYDRAASAAPGRDS